MAKLVLGAQLYTVREFTKTIEGVAQTFKKIRDIGYRQVQISGFGPVDPKDVAKALEDSGLQCVITHMPWDRFLQEIDGVIETHQAWNCKHTAIGGLFTEDYFGISGLRKFLGELPPVLEKLEAAGLDFSYHNHSHEFVKFEGETWLARLFDAPEAARVNAELDTYWVQHGGGDPMQWIRRCARRMPVLHVKDMIITTDRTQRYAAIGEGNLNWPAIMQAAEEVGVESCCVEQDDCYGEDPFDCLARSYRFLHEQFGLI